MKLLLLNLKLLRKLLELNWVACKALEDHQNKAHITSAKFLAYGDFVKVSTFKSFSKSRLFLEESISILLRY